MAGAVANLMVRAGADFSQLQRGMQQAQGSVSSFSSGIRASLGRIGEFAAAIGLERVFEKMVDGMKAAIKTGVDYNASVESSTVAWTTLLGSATKAKQMIQDISTFAAKTQFDTEGVDAMAKYLNNAGYAGKDLFDELSRVADVSGAFNITADNAKEMVRQMSQVSQAQVAYTQDLDILQNQGIPIFKAIASELGINVAGVRKMASEGKISSDIYNKAFNSIASTVKGASNTQSQTFKGMLSTLGDDYKILMGALTKPIFDRLKQELTTLMPILDGFVSLTRGDFKDFTEHLNQAFGKDTGGKIISFVQGAQQAFQSLEGYVNRGKQAIKGIFDIFKGNMAEGNGILKSIGLSDDTVRLIDGYISNVKTEILGFGKWVTSTFTSLFSGNNDLGSSFSKIFNTAKSIALPILTDIVNFTRDSIKRIQEFWDKDGDKIIQAVKDSIKMLSDTFEALKPVLMAVWDSVKLVGTVAFNLFMDAVEFLGGKMDWIIPILGGVVAAIGAFKIINTIIDLYKSWQIVTKLMAVAQAALNLVLDLNPIGIVVLAIGTLVAAGIYLYQNWDTVKDKMSSIMDSIEQAAASMVNGAIDKIDALIRFINKIPGVSIPLVPKVDWGNAPSGSGVGSVGDLPSLAHFATGTDFAPGGLSLVGEEGPELVDLPRGSKVHTANETKNMLGGKSNVYNVTVNTLKADMNEKDLVRALQRMEALST